MLWDTMRIVWLHCFWKRAGRIIMPEIIILSEYIAWREQRNQVFACVYMVVNIQKSNCRHTSNKSDTLVGNKLVFHSDVVGASPVGDAPSTSSFLT